MEKKMPKKLNRKEYDKNYYQAHKTEIRERQRKYSKSPEVREWYKIYTKTPKYRAWWKKYCKKNKERMALWHKKYQETARQRPEFKAKKSRYMKKYYKKNKEKIDARRRKRNLLKKRNNFWINIFKKIKNGMFKMRKRN